ncbi:MAG: hypothetical protein ACE5GE_12395 [Phycisphaerae bacterium]
MTKEEARAWRERWRLVNERDAEHARAATPWMRLRDLEVLFAFARAIKNPIDEPSVLQVRARWARLKEHARGR